jgi:hypothetical protein
MTRQVKEMLTVGAVAGVVQVAAGILMYVTGVYFAPWSMLVSLFVLLSCIIWACQRSAARVRAGGGRPRWLDMVRAGIAASVGTGVIYAAYNLIFITFVYPHFLDDMARAFVGMQVARHLPAQSFEAVRADLSASRIALANLLRLSVFGSILSALVALLMQAWERSRTTQPRVAGST